MVKLSYTHSCVATERIPMRMTVFGVPRRSSPSASTLPCHSQATGRVDAAIKRKFFSLFLFYFMATCLHSALKIFSPAAGIWIKQGNSWAPHVCGATAGARGFVLSPAHTIFSSLHIDHFWVLYWVEKANLPFPHPQRASLRMGSVWLSTTALMAVRLSDIVFLIDNGCLSKWLAVRLSDTVFLIDNGCASKWYCV